MVAFITEIVEERAADSAVQSKRQYTGLNLNSTLLTRSPNQIERGETSRINGVRVRHACMTGEPSDGLTLRHVHL